MRLTEKLVSFFMPKNILLNGRISWRQPEALKIGCQEESLEIGKNSEESWVIEGWGVTIERRWKSDYKKRKLERMAKSNWNSDS